MNDKTTQQKQPTALAQNKLTSFVLLIAWWSVEQINKNINEDPYIAKLTIFHALDPLCTINSTVPSSDIIAADKCDTELNTSSVTCGLPSRESNLVLLVSAKDQHGVAPPSSSLSYNSPYGVELPPQSLAASSSFE